MKLIKKQIVKGNIILTTQTKFLWFKRNRKFEAVEELFEENYKWIELTHGKVIETFLTYQLDKWAKTTVNEPIKNNSK